MCRLLLQRGAHCNARTPGGATALHRACYCGHVAVARLLLAHGADPAAADVAKEISGRTSIPVVVYPDSSHHVEPSNADVEAKLRELSLI